MSGSATSAQALCVILNAAEVRIQATGGIPHDGFWRQVDAEQDAAPDDHEAHRELMAMDAGRLSFLQT